MRVFEKKNLHKHSTIKLCAENNSSFSRKNYRKWKVVCQPVELRKRWMLHIIRDKNFLSTDAS